ncbi:hypothetical protein [Paenibacillus sp.]|uniref:hypothetical protein n=1 Tax=Paenibacillus sp. TaxID=58172 RepID=UPI00281A4B8D|nr:hypothetical protein [Paenibacillus sp.]MDR0267565.1 hypothetical protein [Paenibacillus sp.]
MKIIHHDKQLQSKLEQFDIASLFTSVEGIPFELRHLNCCICLHLYVKRRTGEM